LSAFNRKSCLWFSFCLLLGLAAAAAAAAAPPASRQEPIDRIVAVVGDETVLLSEVDEQLALLQANQQLDMADTAQVAEARRQILNQLIDEKLIFAYAGKQGIVIPDEQVNAQIEETIQNVRERLGSPAAFDAELKKQGLTLEGLRDRYRQDVRRQMMAQRIMEREIRSKVKVTDTDVDTFFRNNKDQLPQKLNQFHLAHILVSPKPDASRRAAARMRAADVLRQLEGGANWDALAAKYSDDPTTAKSGGDLGEANEGEFDPTFEAAVRDLQPGKRSGIVETRFGFHIIELVGRSGTRYHTRHILIQAKPTPADEAAAIQRAQKAHDAAVRGEAWNILVNSYSDDASSKENAGDLGNVPVTQLSREYVEALDSLKVGDISAVLQGPTGYHVFKLLGREAAGPFRLEEIRPQLVSMLTQRKLSEEYDRWITAIRKKSFVEIKGR
jgi:peptidyl-prolyl cis-trans isomerase SurA